VLGRLAFVRDALPGGLRAISASTVIMMPKAKFGQRFPAYREWLQATLASAADGAGEREASIAVAETSKLEQLHGELIEMRQAAAQAAAPSGGATFDAEGRLD
jgi:hypothetical protein